MAPEQIRGTPAVSHKTDLYALGVVLYQMLTGKPPFDGASAVVLMHCHLNEPPPRPSDKVEEIPKELDDLVVKLMAKAPADRPWDAAAVGQVLDGAARQGRARRADRHGLARARLCRGQSPPGRGRACRQPRPRKKRPQVGHLGGLSSGFATRDPDGERIARIRLLEPGSARDAGLVAASSRSADSSATGSGPPAPDTSTARPRR